MSNIKIAHSHPFAQRMKQHLGAMSVADFVQHLRELENRDPSIHVVSMLRGTEIITRDQLSTWLVLAFGSDTVGTGGELYQLGEEYIKALKQAAQEAVKGNGTPAVPPASASLPKSPWRG